MAVAAQADYSLGRKLWNDNAHVDGWFTSVGGLFSDMAELGTVAKANVSSATISDVSNAINPDNLEYILSELWYRLHHNVKWSYINFNESDLDSIANVDLTGAAEGKVLKFNANGVLVVSNDDVGTPATPVALNDLSDVNTASVEDHDLLAYDLATTTWINLSAEDLNLGQGFDPNDSVDASELEVLFATLGAGLMIHGASGEFKTTPDNHKQWDTAYNDIILYASNWQTAYTERRQWDGGSTNLNASTGRTSLGLGSAALRNAADTFGVDETLPDGLAIQNYINARQLSGPHNHGTGTTNTIAKFVASATMGNSHITDDGTTVTVDSLSAFTNTIMESNNANETRLYRNVAQWSIDTANQTGAVKILIPEVRQDSNTMLIIRIIGYNFVDNGGAWEVLIGGYNYVTGFMNASVAMTGTPPFLGVRLGDDGTNNVILLGTTSTVWQYPQIFVETLGTGFSYETGFDGEWSISLVTSETGITVEKTPLVKYYVTVAGWFGLGTVNPASKFDLRNGYLSLTSDNVSHGMTSTLTSTNDWGQFSIMNTDLGGLAVVGASDGSMTGLGLFGIIGSTDPSDTMASVTLSGGKKNAATWQALGNAETVFQLKNFNTNLITVLGNGNTGFLTTTPAYAVDVNGDVRATALRFPDTYADKIFLKESLFRFNVDVAELNTYTDRYFVISSDTNQDAFVFDADSGDLGIDGIYTGSGIGLTDVNAITLNGYAHTDFVKRAGDSMYGNLNMGNSKVTFDDSEANKLDFGPYYNVKLEPYSLTLITDRDFTVKTNEDATMFHIDGSSNTSNFYTDVDMQANDVEQIDKAYVNSLVFRTARTEATASALLQVLTTGEMVLWKPGGGDLALAVKYGNNDLRWQNLITYEDSLNYPNDVYAFGVEYEGQMYMVQVDDYQ